MSQLATRYGLLNGVDYIQYYPNGSVKQVILTEPNQVETPYGVFTPQYSDDGLRRKRVKPVLFYENGFLKNLPLQEQVQVETTIGFIPAELITWYENGEIKRIFPLNGSLTGFWTEEDEYEMAPVLDFNLSCANLRQKIISAQFYETKELKNLTIWPQDAVTIETPVGLTESRIGLSFYPGGGLKAFEPKKATNVDTPIGSISAYDNSAMGIHSDSLSLQFHESGQVKGLSTITNSITVIDPVGDEHHYRPRLQRSLFNLNGKVLVPLKINFDGNKVCFGDHPEHCHDQRECRFLVQKIDFSELGTCDSCDSCSGCGVTPKG